MTLSDHKTETDAAPHGATEDSHGYCLFDASNARLVALNAIAAQTLGGSEDRLAGAAIEELFPGDAVRQAYATALSGPANSSHSCQCEIDGIAPIVGGCTSFQLSLVRLSGSPSNEGFVLATITTTNNKVAAPYRDALTRLQDRTALETAAVLQADKPFAVLFADLNEFKRINDQYGHAAGDLVLQEIARRWQDAVRDDDLVVRYGGDEFVFVLPHIAEMAAVQPVVERLHRALDAPIKAGELELSVGVTMGIALGNGKNSVMAQLIQEADRSMYANKNKPIPGE